MKRTEKIKDFITRSVDIDVCDDVTDDIGVAFIGPQDLTENGKKHFSEVLDMDITVDEKNCIATVHVDGACWKEKLGKVKEFFWAAAGYCSVKVYDEWFAEMP